MLKNDSFLYAQFDFVSKLGTNWVVFLFVILIPVYFLSIKKYQKESLLLFMSTTTFFINQALKGLFRLPRPLDASVLLRTPFDIYGFPSGHTMFYTVFFGYLFFLTFKLHKISKFLRHLVRVVCFYFIALVGVSRVGLGVHYLQDVIGGYLFGGVFLAILLYVDKKFTKVR